MGKVSSQIRHLCLAHLSGLWSHQLQPAILVLSTERLFLVGTACSWFICFPQTCAGAADTLISRALSPHCQFGDGTADVLVCVVIFPRNHFAVLLVFARAAFRIEGGRSCFGGTPARWASLDSEDLQKNGRGDMWCLKGRCGVFMLFHASIPLFSLEVGEKWCPSAFCS